MRFLKKRRIPRYPCSPTYIQTHTHTYTLAKGLRSHTQNSYGLTHTYTRKYPCNVTPCHTQLKWSRFQTLTHSNTNTCTLAKSLRSNTYTHKIATASHTQTHKAYTHIHTHAALKGCRHTHSHTHTFTHVHSRKMAAASHIHTQKSYGLTHTHTHTQCYALSY